MDRCALFVDAGYVLSDGAEAVHGTRRPESVRWDHPGLLKLFADLARNRTGLPVLRCYWYEANADAVPGAEHEALADIPGLKLRLRRAGPGRREGIEADLKRDLLTLARNHAISDALIVTGDENITELVAETQDHGIRVIVAHITAAGRWIVPSALRQECDDLAEIPAEQLRPFAELTGDAGAAAGQERYAHRATSRAAAAELSPGGGAPAVTPVQAVQDSRPAAQYHKASFPSAGDFGVRSPAAAAGPGTQAAAAFDAGHAARQFDSAAHGGGRFGPGAYAAEQVTPGSQAPGHLGPGAYAAGRVTPDGQATGHFDSGSYAAGDPASEGQAAGLPGRGTQNGQHGPGGQAPAQFNGAARAPGNQDTGANASAMAYGLGGADSSSVPARQNGSPQPADMGQRNGWQHDAGAFAAPSGNGRSRHPSADYRQFAEAAAGSGQVPLDGYGSQVSDRAAFGSRNGAGNGQAPGQVAAPQGDGIRAGQSGAMPAPHADGIRAAQSGAMPAPHADGIRAPQSGGMPTAEPVRPVYSTDQWYADSSATSLPGQAGRDGMLPAQPAHTLRSEVPDQAIRSGQAGQADLSGRTEYGVTADQVTRANQVMRSDQAASATQASRSGYTATRDPLGSGSNRETGAAALAAPVYYQQQPAAAALQVPQPAIPSGRFDPTATPLHAATQAQLASAGHLVGASRNGGSQPAAALLAPSPANPPVGNGTSAPVSPSEAGRVARGEGYSFGETVARDAPALWLDAVLARKPRMPSDLEARLLQGSALPIDSLLNDDVRQALRQGFWDALESSRR